MAETVSGINPTILSWARRQSGLSVAEVARKLKRDPAIVEAWERGDSAPTYVQLERLAYGVYHRPVALFFFPAPPDESPPESSFRTLPASEAADLEPDTRYKIREARALQLSLYELNDGTNPAERRIFEDIVIDPEDSAPEVATRVRVYLGLEEVEGRSYWRSASEWFEECRRSVEDVGVFVFKNSFKQGEISGLCLYDPVFPIIYVNNSTTATRQVFTIFHELAHVLLHLNGITKLDDDYIDALPGDERRIEVFCNAFAAEVLIPHEDFQVRVGELRPDEEGELITSLADKYKVSREVVLRRFLDLGRVSGQSYEALVQKWNYEYEEGRSQGSGGNYYNTQAAYLGDRYMGLAFNRYYQGAISEQRLAEMFGVKARNLPGLEQQYLRRVSR